MRSITLGVLAALCLATAVGAQGGRGTTGTGRGTATSKPKAPPTSSVRVSVRDASGALPDVKLTLSGPTSSEETTNGFGVSVFSNLADGVYRLRFDHGGYVSLEREFTVKAPQPVAIEVQLTEAPAPPPPPPAPKPTVNVASSGAPMTMSIPNFLDKNLISGRDPLKESVISCTPLETVRVLQLRDALGEHAHDDADEVLYVVAGEGAVRIGGEATPVSAGSITVVPHGTRHLVERRGRNPLILVSTLSGAPCKAAQ